MTGTRADDVNPYAAPTSPLDPPDELGTVGPELILASVWARLGAFAIDAVLTIPPTYAGLRALDATIPYLPRVFARQHMMLALAVYLLVVLFVLSWPAVYFTLGDYSRSGATIGKRMLRIRVVRPDGRRLSLRRAVLRNLVKVLSNLFIYGQGSLWVFFGKRRRTLSDRSADTLVVQAAPQKTRENGDIIPEQFS